LDEFDDTNTFANMENYGSYSKNVMKHEAAWRILTKIR
jgi:hypothetical protein